MVELLIYVLVVLVGTVVALRWRAKDKQQLIAFLNTYRSPEAEEQWNTNQEWRKPTGIDFLEGLKRKLLQSEDEVIAAVKEAKEFGFIEIVRGSNGKDALQNYHGHGWNISVPSIDALARRRQLRDQLDRLWTGDVYAEAAQRQREIAELERWKADVPRDNKSALLKADQELIELRHELKDLDEIKRRGEKRNAQHPLRSQQRDGQEAHAIGVADDVMRKFEGSKTVAEIRTTWRRLEAEARATYPKGSEDLEVVLAQLERDAKNAEKVIISEAPKPFRGRVPLEDHE